jgi:hypothetical protein
VACSLSIRDADAASTIPRRGGGREKGELRPAPRPGGMRSGLLTIRPPAGRRTRPGGSTGARRAPS